MRISLEHAKKLIADEVLPLKSVAASPGESLGLILAKPVVSEMDQPPFPRSPYDGYALIAADSRDASEENPVTLDVTGISFAGSPADVAVHPGHAVRIMTGGAIPHGADCVITQENTDRGEKTVKVLRQLSPFDNYCHKGEDFKKGEMLVQAGERLNAAVCAVLASAGCCEVSVYGRPATALISTGDELQSPGEKLKPGRIYDSNLAYLSSRLSELSVTALNIRKSGDDLKSLILAFSNALNSADFVISTGGVSVGQKDLVPAALEEMGAKIVFHGVEIKPGMPALLAMLKGKPILALSGNPFACAVSFELLARPILARMASDKALEARAATAFLTEGYSKKRPVRRFMRGTLKNGQVTLPGEQGNGQLKTMIGCNCLVELPAGNEILSENTQVSIYMTEEMPYGI